MRHHPANRAARRRAAVIAVAVLGVLMAWLPYISGPMSDWWEQRRLRNTLTIFYTTDTRGFLETCG